MFRYFICLVLLDLVYYFLTKKFYIKKIEEIQKTKFNFRIIGGIVRYISLFVLFKYFLLDKKVKNKYEPFMLGFLFGILFNSTMWASFSEWNWIWAVLDSLWLGMLLQIVYNL